LPFLSAGQSSKRLPIPQTVEDCLQKVQFIGASPTAKESADTLYRLAKVVDGDSKQRKRFRHSSSEVLDRKVGDICICIFLTLQK